MSAMRPEEYVGHEWQANRRPRCDSVPGVVNATSHLWWVSMGPSAGSTRVVPFRHAQPPLLGFATPDPGLGVAVFDRGWVLSGLTYLPLPTD
jgi:hypothetical protein